MKNIWLKVFLREVPAVELACCSRENLFPDFIPLTGIPGSIGHYDWLRTSDSEIVVVRYWPFDDAIHRSGLNILSQKSKHLDYAEIDSEMRYISFLFTRISHVDESISNDQELGDNGIYLSTQGEIALCFEVDHHANICSAAFARSDSEPS